MIVNQMHYLFAENEDDVSLPQSSDSNNLVADMPSSDLSNIQTPTADHPPSNFSTIQIPPGAHAPANTPAEVPSTSGMVQCDAENEPLKGASSIWCRYKDAHSRPACIYATGNCGYL